MNARRGPARPPSAGLSRRSLLSATLLGGAAAAVGACATPMLSTSSVPDGPDLLIGVNLELSGLNSVVGKDQLNAINIAMNSINQDGFVVGGLRRRIRLAAGVQDNQSKPDVAGAGMLDLAKLPNIAAVVGPGTGVVATAMAPVADARTVPMLSMASAGGLDMGLTRQVYVFMLGPRSSNVAQLLAKAVAVAAPGAARISVVTTDDAYGRDGWTATSTALAASGVTLVQRIAPSSGTKVATFSATAKKVVADKPDAVVVWSLAPISGYIAQALANAGYTGKLFFDSGAGSDETISGTNHAAVQGAYLVAPSLLGGPPVAVTDPASLRRRNFYQSYIVGNQIFSGLAPTGADTILLIVQAAINADSIKASDIRDSMETMRYDGIAGYYSFAANDHSGLTGDSLSIFTIQQNGWAPAGIDTTATT